MGTDPLLLAKLQILVVAAAVVAGLAGWVPFIHLDEVLALLFQLVFEKLPKHAKPIVVCRLAQIQALSHCLQIQVLHAHGSVGVGYPPAFLVRKVLSLVGNVLLKHLDFVELPDVIL